MQLRIFRLLMMVGLTLCIALPAQAAKEEGVVLAASNGLGQIRLVWLYPVERWPAGGWRILDDKGNVLVTALPPFEEAAMTRLNPEEQQALQGLREAISMAAGVEEREQLNALTALAALSSFDKARAMGLAQVLDKVPAGDHVFRLKGLDAAGKTIGPTLVTPVVNGAIATPLPPAPTLLRGQSGLQGAQLFWSPVSDNPAIPVLAYEVERVGAGVPAEVLVRGDSWDPDTPVYVDSLAPFEQELSYRVYSLDVFGRRSEPAVCTFFMTDLAALLPVAGFTAEPGQDRVILSWKPSENPHTAGYVLERSVGRDGLYEPLTPDGLARDKDRFRDTTTIGGIVYHYRLRAVGMRGELGEPTPVATAMPLNRKAPPEPQGLTVQVNPILVTLRWERPEYPVAGYFIERRAKGGDQWSRLNGTVQQEREYQDRFSPEAAGTFAYRVVAVSFDNRFSRPSGEVTAVVGDASAPPPPGITFLDGVDGKVALAFEPGLPVEKTAFFRIRRGRAEQKAGILIARDLPAKTRRFVDTDVDPGRGYWYSVEAVGENGRTSEPTDRRLVMVVPPEFPLPPPPKARMVEKPFPHVVITFKKVQGPFTVNLQRLDNKEASWLTIANGLANAGEMVDASPVAEGTFFYRIVLRSPNGLEGQPSAVVEVQR